MKDAWLHAASLKLDGRTRTAEIDQNGDSSSDTEGQAEDNPVGVSLNNRESVANSLVYDKFLRFLELGCGGSPSQGYPTLVVILSTIPTEVRSSRHFVACNNTLNSQYSLCYARKASCNSYSHRYGWLLMVKHYLHHWKGSVEKTLPLSYPLCPNAPQFTRECFILAPRNAHYRRTGGFLWDFG